MLLRLPILLLLLLQLMLQLLPRPWRNMEYCQPSAWTANRNLLVASRVKAFRGRPTNSGSNLLRAAHLEGGGIGCHQCITSNSGSAPASPDMRPTPLICPAGIPSAIYIPDPTKPTIALINYAHAQTVTNSSAFHLQL